jgi:hypothetical protein
MTLEQFIELSSIGCAVFILLVICLRGICYIPQNKIGIVEKFWSTRGSLREGRIIALNREAGFQADTLRGGIHFGYYPWQYRIHQQPLVTVGKGHPSEQPHGCAASNLPSRIRGGKVLTTRLNLDSARRGVVRDRRRQVRHSNCFSLTPNRASIHLGCRSESLDQ